MANTWLKQKSDILLKYASKLPTKLDRVSIKFDYPEVGYQFICYKEIDFIQHDNT